MTSSNLSVARGVFAITPGPALLDVRARAIWVNIGGDVSIVAADGTTATFTCLPGALIPVECLKVTAGPDGLIGLV